MASGQPFLTLTTIPPLDLTMEDGTSMLQVGQRADSDASASTAPEPRLSTQIKEGPKPPASKHSLCPSPSLRKSVSVDSFAQYGRESPVLSGPRPNRGNTSSALEPPRNMIYGVSSSLKKEREELQANRNHSSVYAINKNDEPSNHDADLSDVLSSSAERYHHSSLKPQEQMKSFLRAGEGQTSGQLARTPTLSTASSLSSAISDLTTGSSRLGDASRSLSSSSLQQLPRRGTVPAIAPPSRARSGSLGVYSSTPLKRPMTGDATAFDVRKFDPTVTLVVAGSPACGKSTIIRKGLKKFALSEPIACRTISGIPGLPSVTNYIRRTGRVGQLETVIDCPLKVLEANVLPSSHQGSSPVRNNPILDPVSRLDGVIICYDASNPSSFVSVEKMLSDYGFMRIPILVLACKSDLVHRVDSAKAHSLCKHFDVGLIEVNHEAEKDRISLAFEFLLQAVWRDRRDKRQGSDVKYYNPASPRLLKHSPLWHTSGSTTPVASSPLITVNLAPSDPNTIPSSGPGPLSPPTPTTQIVKVSLTNPRNQGEPLVLNWKRGQQLPVLSSHSPARSEAPAEISSATVVGSAGNINPRDTLAEKPEPKEKDLKPTLYMTIDELLDKLLFLAVSADDPSFITHFLLTYRRFATPRNVLLAMQKRMRQLDGSSGDPMFACFAQMRICALLEAWIQDYPCDFAVRGTAGALSALIKSILAKSYLLHYGSELLPFLETLPSLKDEDSAWALKVNDIGDTSDSESAFDDEEVVKPVEMGLNASSAHSPAGHEKTQPARERKSSLPLAKALKQVVVASVVNGHGSESAELSTKHKVKELIKLAHEAMLFDSETVAQEITRLQAKLFLNIQPRDWLHLTFVGKNESSESITTLIAFSNHLAEWVLSLILCHDKPRNRARQVEKFVEIATKLRHLNNYSALRAFIAGIHGSTYPGDETMELFKSKSPEHYKSLQSWEVLFRPLRSHRAYRMALRNSKGGCVPALEVHIQDLIRAHEGNPDMHAGDGTKIHWGKFNLIGKFIISTTHCQIQCRSAGEYRFPDRGDVVERLLRYPLMTEELKTMRLPPEYAETEDSTPKHSQAKLPSSQTTFKPTTPPMIHAIPLSVLPLPMPAQNSLPLAATTHHHQPSSQAGLLEPVSPKTITPRPLSAQALPPSKKVFAESPPLQTRGRGLHAVTDLQYW